MDWVLWKYEEMILVSLVYVVFFEMDGAFGPVLFGAVRFNYASN